MKLILLSCVLAAAMTACTKSENSGALNTEESSATATPEMKTITEINLDIISQNCANDERAYSGVCFPQRDEVTGIASTSTVYKKYKLCSANPSVLASYVSTAANTKVFPLNNDEVISVLSLKITAIESNCAFIETVEESQTFLSSFGAGDLTWRNKNIPEPPAGKGYSFKKLHSFAGEPIRLELTDDCEAEDRFMDVCVPQINKIIAKTENAEDLKEYRYRLCLTATEEFSQGNSFSDVLVARYINGMIENKLFPVTYEDVVEVNSVEVIEGSHSENGCMELRIEHMSLEAMHENMPGPSSFGAQDIGN